VVLRCSKPRIRLGAPWRRLVVITARCDSQRHTTTKNQRGERNG
jgi:hypothetical protein